MELTGTLQLHLIYPLSGKEGKKKQTRNKKIKKLQLQRNFKESKKHQL
jgi:hypothetical protein